MKPEASVEMAVQQIDEHQHICLKNENIKIWLNRSPDRYKINYHIIRAGCRKPQKTVEIDIWIHDAFLQNFDIDAAFETPIDMNFQFANIPMYVGASIVKFTLAN